MKFTLVIVIDDIEVIIANLAHYASIRCRFTGQDIGKIELIPIAVTDNFYHVEDVVDFKEISNRIIRYVQSDFISSATLHVKRQNGRS